MREAGGMLLRDLLARAGGEGGAVCRSAHSERWVSVTFSGARHRFALLLTGRDAARRATRLEKAMGDIEFALPGHLVADIVVAAKRLSAEGVILEIEALTVEEA